MPIIGIEKDVNIPEGTRVIAQLTSVTSTTNRRTNRDTGEVETYPGIAWDMTVVWPENCSGGRVVAKTHVGPVSSRDSYLKTILSAWCPSLEAMSQFDTETVVGTYVTFDVSSRIYDGKTYYNVSNDGPFMASEGPTPGATQVTGQPTQQPAQMAPAQMQPAQMTAQQPAQMAPAQMAPAQAPAQMQPAQMQQAPAYDEASEPF